MKKLIFILLGAPIALFSQTYKDIISYSTNFNKEISTIESKFKIKPVLKNDKFGIESLLYNIEDYTVAFTESKKDNGLVADVLLYNMDKDLAGNVWYKVVSEFQKDKTFVEKEAYINDKNKSFKSKDLRISEIIVLLRNLNYSKGIDYAVVYSKAGNDYALLVIDGVFMFNLKDVPFVIEL